MPSLPRINLKCSAVRILSECAVTAPYHLARAVASPVTKQKLLLGWVAWQRPRADDAKSKQWIFARSFRKARNDLWHIIDRPGQLSKVYGKKEAYLARNEMLQLQRLHQGGTLPGFPQPLASGYLRPCGSPYLLPFLNLTFLPNMICVGDCEKTEGRPAFFRDCGSLRVFCEEILRAVELMHVRGVLHLDLKPRNFLVSRREPALKSSAPRGIGIVDFEGAGQIGHPAPRTASTDFYAAPEMEEYGALVRDHRLDRILNGRLSSQALFLRAQKYKYWNDFIAPWTDLHALGVSFRELLEHFKDESGSKDFETINKAAEWCHEENRADRPRSAAEVLKKVFDR